MSSVSRKVSEPKIGPSSSTGSREYADLFNAVIQDAISANILT
jgi:hypothetical protein